MMIRLQVKLTTASQESLHQTLLTSTADIIKFIKNNMTNEDF